MDFLKLLFASLLNLVNLLLQLSFTELKVQLLLLEKEIDRSQRAVQRCFWILTTQRQLQAAATHAQLVPCVLSSMGATMADCSVRCMLSMMSYIAVDMQAALEACSHVHQSTHI